MQKHMLHRTYNNENLFYTWDICREGVSMIFIVLVLYFVILNSYLIINNGL